MRNSASRGSSRPAVRPAEQLSVRRKLSYLARTGFDLDDCRGAWCYGGGPGFLGLRHLFEAEAVGNVAGQRGATGLAGPQSADSIRMTGRQAMIRGAGWFGRKRFSGQGIHASRTGWNRVAPQVLLRHSRHPWWRLGQDGYICKYEVDRKTNMLESSGRKGGAISAAGTRGRPDALGWPTWQQEVSACDE